MPDGNTSIKVVKHSIKPTDDDIVVKLATTTRDQESLDTKDKIFLVEVNEQNTTK